MNCPTAFEVAKEVSTEIKKIVKKVQVKNPMGLHTRPATEIVKLLQNFKSQVSLTYKKETINARSILGILMLAAGKNSRITISIEGIDADEALEKLMTVFEGGL